MFRYRLLADIVHLPPGTPGVGERLRDKARHTYVIPGTRRTRVAAETLRDWLALYRSGGFDALYPKARTDRGQPRRLPPQVAEQLVSLKTEHPTLSVNALIKTARERGIDHPLAPSTVHRLLSREGLLDKHPDDPVATDRRRFAFRDAGECWQSDVMHGPKVRDGRTRRKTYLIAFIDDATRAIPFAAFAFSENTTAFLPVFKNALIRRGLPMRLFVDNGANYRSQQLALVCCPSSASRSSTPVPISPPEREKSSVGSEPFAPPGSPASTPRPPRASTHSIAASGLGSRGSITNPLIAASTGAPPLDQWALAGENVRYPDPTLDLDDLFLFEAKRRVMKDRTVSLHGRLYEVDALLVGHTVTLRYDPHAPPSRPLEVVHDGQPSGLATVLDAYANTTVKRHRPSWQLQCDNPPPEPSPSPLAMRKLKEKK